MAVDLFERALAADVFANVDLLNVNAPVDVADPHARITRPTHDHDLVVEHDESGSADRESNDGTVAVDLRDCVWPDTEGFENPFPLRDDHRERYPQGCDRRAMVEGEASVSPLRVDHGHAESESLAGVVELLLVE